MVVGHSLGAVVAAREAARRPYRRLAFCSTSPLGVLATQAIENFLPQVRAVLHEARQYAVVRQLSQLTTAAVFGNIRGTPENASVMVGQCEVVEETALQAAEISKRLGVKTIVVPEAAHFVETFPSYREAVVRAVTKA